MTVVRRLRGWVAPGLALLVLALSPGAPTPAFAQSEGPVRAQDGPAVKKTQRDLLMQGARRRLSRAADEARLLREESETIARGFAGPPRPAGLRVRPSLPDPDVESGLIVAGVPSPALSVQATLAQPTNVLVNNKTGDAVGAGQSEEYIAMLGNFGLCAWNDGQGFVVGPHTQGVGYTTDGGATWVDVGNPPVVSNIVWTSDPVVTVNEKTGDFYYCGLIDQGTNNGLAIVRATFPGGVFTWDTPRIIRTLPNSTDFIDKEWVVCDSSAAPGRLYVTYTHFLATGDSIIFQRSTDHGVTWGPKITMNSSASQGLVQGSRTAVGPAGEVYCIWYEIGPVDQDFFRIKKSTNAGVSFGAVQQVTGFFDNFGTGAPGFNRERGIGFPSLNVDRSTGPNRGRVHFTWNESINWYNDPLGGSGAKSEVEPNGTSGTASIFVINNKVRGSLSSTSEQDWFRFAATQGSSYIFWLDSLVTNMRYEMRIFCSDGSTRLAYGGHPLPWQVGENGNGFTVFTAPTTGNFFLRISGAGGGTGAYRVQTGPNGVITERSRDSRDIFANFTDNGTSFSTPARVNDDSGWFHNWLPEVAVARDGYPYVEWYDWRDDAACGGSSHLYTSRSTDGGATWVANQRVSTATSAWTTVLSNIAPNQGDYNGMYGGDVLLYNWGDGRAGDVDTYMAKVLPTFSVSSSGGQAASPLDVVALSFDVTNDNVIFGQTLNYTLTSQRNWPLPGGGSTAVGPGGVNNLPFNVTVPDTAADGPNNICLIVTQPNGALSRTSCQTITVENSLVGVPPTVFAFALGQSKPNPAKDGRAPNISFSLPTAGRASLKIFGARGEVVRTLFDDTHSAGPDSVNWDLKDDSGHSVASGIYYYRLTFAGRHLERRMAVVR